MNAKTFLKLGALLVLLFMATASLLAQSTGLATVYVDVTNGSDSYTGANSTNSPAGAGPKATINAGIKALADAGTLVIVAGDYQGADGLGGDLDMSATTFTNITTGFTMKLTQLNGTLSVNLAAGQFIWNINNATLTITNAGNNEFFNVAAGNMWLGNTTNSSMISMANTAFMKLSASSPSIIMSNASGFTNKAPTINNSTSSVSLSYNGTGSITAGAEAAYSTFGNGTIAVTKTSGSVTFTSALLLPGVTGTNAININGGDAIFNGTVTVGRVGSSSSTNAPTSPDIAVQTASNATFNKAVTLYNAGTSLGQIKNTSTGTVTFNDVVLWNTSYNATGGGSGGTGASSLVYNSTTGSILFNSTFTLSNATTTSSNSTTSSGAGTATTYTYNMKIYNAANGTITIAQPITNTTKVDGNGNTLAFSVDVINNAAGTLTFSSAIVNNLTSSGGNGTIALNGATTVGAVITMTNSGSSSSTVSLGANTLTIKTAGTTASPTVHGTYGGTFSSSGGGITISGGVMTFDGGTFPNITQSGGTVSFITNATTTGAFSQTGGTLNVNYATTLTGNVGIAGTFNANAATTVVGNTTVSTGSLNIADATSGLSFMYKTVGFSQTGGSVAYGGNKVSSITLGSGGSGFTSVPAVGLTNATGDPGVGASATAVLTPTTVANIGMTNPGSGYTDAPTIVFTGGGASAQATATATLTPTSVASVSVLTAGVGYTGTPSVTFSAAPGGGVTATGFATVDLVAGTVTAITVTNPGSGYVAAPTITLGAAGQSTAATTVVKLNPVTVASVTLVGGGTGYTGTPTITITTPTNQSGSGLAVSTLFTATSVASYSVVGGANYKVAPTVAVTGGGGTGATGTAVLSAIYGVLEVDGDMARTSGTFNALAGSTVQFEGNGAQNLNGGQLFQADKIKFVNTSGVITLSSSIRALTSVTISAGTNLALGTFNIILSQAGGLIDNSGTYTATGGGGVVLGGSNTVANGGSGASMIRASATGIFSNIIVDPGNVGGPYVVTVDPTSGSLIKFNGVLTLRSGSLNIAAGADFAPTGSTARIIRDVSNAAGSLVGSTGITVAGGGGFNGSNTGIAGSTATAFDLEYQGTLAADANAGAELTSSTTNVRSLTLNVTGDIQTPPDGLIDYYIVLSTAQTFGGTLTVNSLSGLKLSTGVALTLSATGVTHTIKGELKSASGTDIFKFTGANVTVMGSTAKADPAMIGNVEFGSGTTSSTITVSNVQNFSGTVNCKAFSTVTLGMGSTDNTATGIATTEQQITGLLTLAGTSFTLGSNLEAQGGVQFGAGSNAGSLNFGAFNLKVSGGNYAMSAGIGLTYSSTGGALIMNSAGSTLALTSSATTEALPNLTIAKNATLATSSGYVSGKLIIGTSAAAIPTLTMAGFNLTVTGSGTIILTDDGTGSGTAATSTGSGGFIITGAAVTLKASGNYTLGSLTFNPTSGIGTLSLATDDTVNSPPTARTFAVAGLFTHSAGVLALDINDLSLTGAGSVYVRTVAGGGTITSNGGFLGFDGSSGAQTFSGGAGFVVPNVRVNNTGGVSNALGTTGWTISGTLDLTAGTLTTGNASLNLLTLSSGATVIRRAAGAVLDQKATLAGTVNLDYEVPDATPAVLNDNSLVNLTLSTATAYEMPSSSTALNNLTINNTSNDGTVSPVNYGGKVILGRAITVNGTLKVKKGILDNSTYGVSIASGGSLEMAGGSIAAAPTTSTYALIYSSGTTVTLTTSSFEFPDPSTSTVVITSLTIKGTNTKLVLNGARTVGGLTLNASGGGLDLNGKVLTVSGGVTVTKGSFQNGITTQSTLYLYSTTGSTTQSFKGGVKALAAVGGPQVITVPAAGLTLPYNVDLKLEDAAGFTLTGGNLIMSYNGGSRTVTANTIYFVNGVLATGANSVVLAQTTLGQGYDRSAVVGTNVSHINGKVRHSIPGGAGGATYVNGRFEFPVGTATKYRPMAITFTNTYPAINPTNVDVSQVDSTPGGRVGLPLDGGNSIHIGNYPAFYWLVTTTPSSFTASQQFDAELQGTNLGYPFTSAGDLRIVRRQDGNADINPWQLQGTASSYQANYINVGTSGDSTIFVRSSSSLGGLVTQGSRFSIGIPTRAPTFATAPTSGTVDENATLTQQFTGNPNNVGETIAYSLISPPTGVTIGASSGVLTWTPTYDQAGVYVIVVSITNGEYSVTSSDTVTVVNYNRPPVFSPRTVAATVKDSDTLKTALAATDLDKNTITYSYISVSPATTNAPAVSGTTLTWKPTFADAGKTYAILVLASDGVTTGDGPKPGTDTLTVNVTVNRSRARGDVDGNGSVQAADASLVLQHVAGIKLITDPAALYAADASNNGTITAYDAALILQAAAGLITLPASTDAKVSFAKGEAVAGSLAWAAPEATSDPSVVRVGLKLSNAANVYAAQLTSNADFSALSVEGVKATVPEGWLVEWNVVGNELRIAMAGITPLSSGDVGSIMLRLKNKESRLNFSTEAMLNESFQSVGAVEIAAVPTVFALEQNYPNPFNPSTTIKYQIPSDANVNLVIWNLQGQQIRTLIAKEQKAGYYNVVWDGRNEAGQTVSSGFYLYRVQAGSFVAVHKMMLIK